MKITRYSAGTNRLRYSAGTNRLPSGGRMETVRVSTGRAGPQPVSRIDMLNKSRLAESGFGSVGFSNTLTNTQGYLRTVNQAYTVTNAPGYLRATNQVYLKTPGCSFPRIRTGVVICTT